MNLIIMGVGYVGMPLLQQLQTLNYSVYTTTRSPEKVERLKEYSTDVILLPPDNDRPLKQLIDDCDAMIVLIAPKNGSTYKETYLKTAQEIMNALKGRTKPFSIIYTSSTSVYEGSKTEWSTEDLSLAPSSENAQILLKTENTFLQHPDTCILRLGGIFGPGRELHKRVASLSGKPYPGNGDAFTNHIHLDNIVSGIIFCLENRLNGIYNLVNNDHPTRKALYADLCQQLAIAEPIWKDNDAAQSTGYKVSNSKIVSAGYVDQFKSISSATHS